MSLPAAWTDRIFDKLSMAYGRDFLGRWEGLDLNAVKSDWSHELAGFQQQPQAIAHGLQNLPERCPNVFEFRAACRRYKPAETLRIESPVADAARISAELARLAPVLQSRHARRDPRQWAYDLIARHQANPQLVSQEPLRMARRALALRQPDIDETALSADEMLFAAQQSEAQ